MDIRIRFHCNSSRSKNLQNWSLEKLGMFNTIFPWNDYNLATKMIKISFQMLTNFTTPLIGSFRALWKWNDSSCSPVPSRFLHFMKEMFHRFFRVFKLMLISGVIILAVNPVWMQTPVRTSELFGNWNL